MLPLSSWVLAFVCSLSMVIFAKVVDEGLSSSGRGLTRREYYKKYILSSISIVADLLWKRNNSRAVDKRCRTWKYTVVDGKCIVKIMFSLCVKLPGGYSCATLTF